jgi:hypothetical protein
MITPISSFGSLFKEVFAPNRVSKSSSTYPSLGHFVWSKPQPQPQNQPLSSFGFKIIPSTLPNSQLKRSGSNGVVSKLFESFFGIEIDKLPRNVKLKVKPSCLILDYIIDRFKK